MGHNVEGNYWTTHIEGYPFVYPSGTQRAALKNAPVILKQTEETVTNEAIRRLNVLPSRQNTPPRQTPGASVTLKLD